MPAITIYTTAFCPYCHMAKRLLTSELHTLEREGKLDALLASA